MNTENKKMDETLEKVRKEAGDEKIIKRLLELVSAKKNKSI